MSDVTPEEGRSRRFSRPGKITAVVFAVLAGLALIGVAGVSYATYSYSNDYEGRILPGGEIAGVDVSGMNRKEAIRAVRKSMAGEMGGSVSVGYEAKTWSATRSDLGAKLNIRAAVRDALAASERASFLEKARMRVFGDELSFTRGVAIRYPMEGITGFVAGIASDFNQKPKDAELNYSTGWVKIQKAEAGRELHIEKSARALASALRAGEEYSDLAVTAEAPEVTGEAFEKVLLVHIGENKLYLYEKGKITHEWTVATGMPDFMTPQGLFAIELKRYMPTWVNPHPDEGWGLSMPASIPPGPSNPLGLRALNWTAPNIRFHGTPAVYSLGYNASHGCVRMANEDVVELYDLVDEGTPIVSVLFGDLRPM